ncbi:MAG: cbb3-type cytochrome c oxidase N-terminal domain-containing protein [Aureisphaera sp.]
MRTIASYIRVLFFITIAAVFLSFIVSPDAPLEAFGELWFWGVIGLLATLLIVAEICIGALRAILFRSLDEEAKQRYEEQKAADNANQFKWFRKTYKKLLGSKPIEQEHEIILDHNYDGIKELDNRLPPWWVYSFYITIVFAVVYLVRFHVFNDYTQAEEYDTEVAIAKAEIEEWKKTAKDLVDVNTVTLLTEAGDLNSGRTIFEEKCVACHKADGGGGIGPNLTDDYWILGGGIKNTFQTISEGGRTGKGMVPWKSELKPSEIAQVASYVLSLQGTTPAEPKEAEGEVWIDPDATPTEEELPIKVEDSTIVQEPN